MQLSIKLNTKVLYTWPDTNFFTGGWKYNLIWLYDWNKPIEVSCNRLEYFSSVQTSVRMKIKEFINNFIII